MRFFTNKTATLSVCFLLLGTGFMLIENSVYQYVDHNGVLHESLFMPLSILCFALGVLFVFSLLARQVIELFKSARAEES
ncbi:hypothetical protein PSEHALCIP103_02029 [Pseudoalteromonas haloplanktis]|uniref:DUF3955 domain-containing protein n=1 Tax=Pseudoalteromonas haloplanktis TaxID=228 RepID=A0A9W4VRD2_PSEHA|nr:DUF3955 domain-containing protein [Pseudoalteromonas haloplanktis]CAH9059277.1 hypothetical protein PSEHALCIP103_02029 [Pseudoalteromonas haloplanktis]